MVQDAQLAYYYEEDKLKYAKEYAKELEQEKLKAEQELAEEKLKAEQELVEEKRNGHKLLISSFFKNKTTRKNK
ncbi:MAG: hypothetical protein HC803_00400 [Saprospiraceae bacterium]|nr:hypothetical protein [Saprospiraceae bacterium]